MTKQQTDRMVAALEGISLGLNEIGRIMEKRLDLEFPPQKEQADAEIFRQGEQGNEAEISPGPGRFEKLLIEATK